jgi:lipocalin
MIEELYKSFVGADELRILTERFSVSKFTGRWEQVMTSASTQLMGTGLAYSSVHAIYTLLDNGTLKVDNGAYDEDIQKVSISGTSKKINKLETCRTVKFDNLWFEGNYWLIYVTESHDTVIVAAPIILQLPYMPICITGNLGLYVLTRDRNKFWKNQVNEIQSVLKRYGFDKWYNRPVVSGVSKLI